MGHVLTAMQDSQRKDLRFPIEFNAIAHWDDQFAFVRVIDIADGGMRLLGESLPDEGEALRLGAKGLNESATVAWRNGHSCGIAMHRRIKALQVVRANCRPGDQARLDHQPLDTIRVFELASRLLEVFQDEERAFAFLRAPARAHGML